MGVLQIFENVAVVPLVQVQKPRDLYLTHTVGLEQRANLGKE